MEIITTHLNADFDSLGAILGAKKIYPDASPVFSGSQEGNLRRFLEDSNYPFGFLKARHVNLDEVSRLIIVDANSASRIGIFSSLLDRPEVKIHIYDHHPEVSLKFHGDFECIRNVGATTTILTELIREKEISLTREEATILGMGIYEDTFFLSSSTTKPADLRAVAWLLENGADLNAITKYVNRNISVSQVHLLNDLLNNVERMFINGLTIIVSTATVKEYIADLAVLAGRVRELENIDVLFVLVQMEDRVHLVARSILASVNVGLIAKEFGGGGHVFAASATIHNKTLIQAREELIKIIKGRIRLSKCAVDIMSRPVKWILEDGSIRKAKDLMIRCHLNTIVILNQQKELTGIITRQTIDRALVHKMGDVPISQYMHSDIRTASEHISMREIRKMMIEEHQRFLPIVAEKKVLGVITRGDLLRDIHEEIVHYAKIQGNRRVQERARHKNLKHIFNERLSTRQKQIIRDIGEVADELNLSAFLVGGVVRDLLLREKNFDLDVVIEENGIDFARHLARRVNGRFRAYDRFCTAVVIFPDGFKLDVATARTEFYEHPAALPIVDTSSIKQDLYRRDFTINALVVRINSKGFGEMIDFFGGERDLKDRLIRILHSLSFVEDPTRIFRAIRFEKRLGFHIGSHTLNLLKNAVREGFCEHLDNRRLLYELTMIFQEIDPTPVIERMAELDLLKCINPGIKNHGFLLKLMQSIKAVLDWYQFLFLPAKPDKTLIYLMAFMQDITRAEVNRFANRFSFTSQQMDIINTMQKEHKRVLSFLSRRDNPPNSLLFNALLHLPLENLLFLMALSETEKAREKISRYLTSLAKTNIQIAGNDLIGMGLSPGPLFRKIFQDVHNKKLDGFVSSRRTQLEYVRGNYASS